jgi:hypothetical protein
MQLPHHLIHSVNNELTVVIRRAELLALEADDRIYLEHSTAIKSAALKLQAVIESYSLCSE